MTNRFQVRLGERREKINSTEFSEQQNFLVLTIQFIRSQVGGEKISVEVYELFLFCSELRVVCAARVGRPGGNWRGEMKEEEEKEDCQEERPGPTLEERRSW